MVSCSRPRMCDCVSFNFELNFVQQELNFVSRNSRRFTPLPLLLSLSLPPATVRPPRSRSRSRSTHTTRTCLIKVNGNGIAFRSKSFSSRMFFARLTFQMNKLRHSTPNQNKYGLFLSHPVQTFSKFAVIFQKIHKNTNKKQQVDEKCTFQIIDINPSRVDFDVCLCDFGKSTVFYFVCITKTEM